MDVSYSLTLDDFIAFQKHLYKRQGKRVSPWGCAPLVILLVFCITAYGAKEGFEVTHVLLILGFLAIIPAYHWYLRLLFKRAFAKVGEAWRDVHLELTPTELIYNTAASVSATRWNAIARVVRTDAYGFIHFTDSSATAIPSRAFPSQSDFETFMDTAKRYFEQAKTKSA